MGLLGKNKRKRPSDFDVLSGDGLIRFVKANLKNPTEKNVLKAVQAIAEPDKDQTHLTPDGELPWGWLSQNMPHLKAKYEDKMVAIAVSLNGLTVDEKIAQLKKLIALYSEFKEFCYSKDECYVKYFSDMWEHCHNSRCKDFEYITQFKVELKNLEDNYEELIQKEQRSAYIEKNILPTLRKTLMTEIKAEPGILQATLTKLFDPDLKQYISSELYQMEKAGLIIREKFGRSYAVYPKFK